MSKTLISLSVVTIAVLFAAFAFAFVQEAKASAPSGLPATVSTTSPESIGASALTIFATSTCAARVITTAGSPLELIFTDSKGQVPTATFGLVQASSTTVVYDSGQYGCSAMKGYSAATQLLTVMETQ